MNNTESGLRILVRRLRWLDKRQRLENPKMLYIKGTLSENFQPNRAVGGQHVPDDKNTMFTLCSDEV
jgi:hypothetical protein